MLARSNPRLSAAYHLITNRSTLRLLSGSGPGPSGRFKPIVFAGFALSRSPFGAAFSSVALITRTRLNESCSSALITAFPTERRAAGVTYLAVTSARGWRLGAPTAASATLAGSLGTPNATSNSSLREPAPELSLALTPVFGSTFSLSSSKTKNVASFSPPEASESPGACPPGLPIVPRILTTTPCFAAMCAAATVTGEGHFSGFILSSAMRCCTFG
mmetsp:Transcript_840/g.3551  ORF Transcript_840/g.3551 Transcript_840/m.3551 type:complete len:217 (+) Transcript_840:186-836(+)